MSLTGKAGRARRYDFAPMPGFANPEVARQVALLDEMHERMYDLIIDLPQEAMDFVPEGGNNSIAMLALHIVKGEASWVGNVMQSHVDEGLAKELQAGSQDGATGELPYSSHTGSELVALARRVSNELTHPLLRNVDDIDSEVRSGDRILTIRGVLLHLVWHITNHSGQIGMLRRLAGERYRWQFGENL